MQKKASRGDEVLKVNFKRKACFVVNIYINESFMYYYNVMHLKLYGYKLLNRWDVSRKLNTVNNSSIARYYYSGRNKVWFINEKYINIILKKQYNI